MPMMCQFTAMPMCCLCWPKLKTKKAGSFGLYINQVRQRALGQLQWLCMACTNQGFAANELAILFERDKEFVWENKRWFDVLRMQDASGQAAGFFIGSDLWQGNPGIEPKQLKPTKCCGRLM
jgi:hypothetical protein